MSLDHDSTACATSEMRACNKCGETKPLTEEFFLRRRARPQLFGPRCRACCNAVKLSGAALRAKRKAAGKPLGRSHYKRSPRGKAYQDHIKKELRINNPIVKFITQLKMSKGCADCGYNAHPVALDFDHLPGYEKRYGIAQIAYGGYGLDLVLEEIAKCEVVCANCHRIRTLDRRLNKS